MRLWCGTGAATELYYHGADWKICSHFRLLEFELCRKDIDAELPAGPVGAVDAEAFGGDAEIEGPLHAFNLDIPVGVEADDGVDGHCL